MNLNFNRRHEQQKLKMDLSRRPFVEINRDNRVAGAVLMLFGLLWGGLPLFFTLKELLSKQAGASLLPALIFGSIGAGIFMLGLWLMTRTVKTVITDHTVSREAKWFLGHNCWEEPLKNYPGVMQRSEYHSGGKNSSGYTLYIVEMHHPDPKKRVCLYESRSPDGIRGIWEDCCRAMGMPALEQDGSKITSRAVEDLDKSVRDLAREGKLDVRFDPSSPPPHKLEISTGKGYLRVKIKSAGAQLVGLLIGVLFSASFVYIGFFNDVPVVFGFAGLLFLLIIIAATAWELFTRAAVDISPDKVRVFRLTPWGETSEQILKTTAIETVRIGKKPDGHQKAVQIITDEKNVDLGVGLSSEAQEWLKNCILAIITR